MSEHDEQVALITWFRYQHPKLVIFAIPNGGLRNKAVAVKLRKEGVLRGVPDLFLMLPKNGRHGLFIEMKSKDGVLTDAQADFIEVARETGYQAEVCYGFDQAKHVIEEYLNE